MERTKHVHHRPLCTKNHHGGNETSLGEEQGGWVTGDVLVTVHRGDTCTGQVLGKPGPTKVGDDSPVSLMPGRKHTEEKTSVNSSHQVARNSVLRVPSLWGKRLVNSKLR